MVRVASRINSSKPDILGAFGLWEQGSGENRWTALGSTNKEAAEIQMLEMPLDELLPTLLVPTNMQITK